MWIETPTASKRNPSNRKLIQNSEECTLPLTGLRKSRLQTKVFPFFQKIAAVHWPANKRRETNITSPPPFILNLRRLYSTNIFCRKFRKGLNLSTLIRTL